MDELRAAAFLQRDHSTLWRATLDGVMILAPAQDEPLHLTSPGDVLWHLVAQKILIGDLVSLLAEQFGTSTAIVQRDIEPVLIRLIEVNAIRISDDDESV